MERDLAKDSTKIPKEDLRRVQGGRQIAGFDRDSNRSSLPAGRLVSFTAFRLLRFTTDSFLSASFPPCKATLLGQQKAYTISLLLLPTISSHASLKIFFSHIYTNSSYLILICDYKRGIIIKWNAYMINNVDCILVTIIHTILQMIFSICFYQYHWSCVRFLKSPRL